MKIIYLSLFLLCVGSNLSSQTIIFEDNFSSTTLNSAWTARPNLTGSNGVVDISTANPSSGQYSIRMGKLNDNGGGTTNALDLKLNLAGKSQVEMTFRIDDNADETNVISGDGITIFNDGISFSNDGGATFRSVYGFLPESWCDQYGQFPPFDIDELAKKAGLSLTANFVIRFQQYDDGDFGFGTIAPDGFFIDDVKVYEPVLNYATLPLTDNFEKAGLDTHWAWRFADVTAGSTVNFTHPSNFVEVGNGFGLNNTRGLRMGKRCDDGYVVNALDLHLNLAGKTQVEMTFKIEDEEEETHDLDGLYFSNDGGKTFKKAFDFKPELWCDQFGQFPPLDIDELAAKIGLTLTGTFVIRFQQYDDGDFGFGTITPDGFYIDDINVYEPVLKYADLPLTDNFEKAGLDTHWAWRFAEATSGTATNVSRPSNFVEVGNGFGINNTRGLRMGKRCDDGFVTNALDLHLNLAGKTQVEMTFKIEDEEEETHDLDGLYFSNDGGKTFKKAFDFKPELWCDQFGQFPPLDIDELAAKIGVTLTGTFIIRFQQYDDGDFGFGTITPDGFYIDDVNVYEPVLKYADLPLTDNFEKAGLDTHWAWRFAEATSGTTMNVSRPSNLVEVGNGFGFNNTRGLRMGKRCDDGFVTNALDLYLNLAGKTQVEMTFKIEDEEEETHDLDGLYFSNDGGKTFKKAFDFKPELWCDQFGQFPPLDIDELAAKIGLTLTGTFVIRFQQYDDGDFGFGTITPDGFYIDDVNVYVPNIKYAALPFSEDFEKSNLGESMAWRFADLTATPTLNVSRPSNFVEITTGTGVNNTKGLKIGKRCDDGYTTNAVDLYLNLLGKKGVELTFAMEDNSDESDAQDGIYFSANGGLNFVKVASFDFNNTPNNTYYLYKINVDSLAQRFEIGLTNQFVIRFQQHDDGDFGFGTTPPDGIYIDNINVKANTTSITEQEINADLTLSPNPTNNSIQINYKNTEGGIQKLEVYNSMGGLALSQKDSNNTNLALVDVSKLPVGIYCVKVFTTKGLGVMKFVKN